MSGVTDLYAQALQLHAAGHFQQAEQLLRQIVEVVPHYADAYHMLGVVAFQTGRHADAIEAINKAIELAPWAGNFRSNLGLVEEALGHDEQAVACFQQAINLQADLPEAYANLANVRHRQGKLQDAAAHYRAALRLQPNFADASFGLGVVLTKLGELGEAEGCLQHALRCRPGFPEAYNNLGNIYLYQGKLPEAGACYQQALQLRHHFPEAHNNLANVRLLQGAPQQAIPHFKQALALRPGYTEARNNLADTLNNLGDALSKEDKLDQAIECFQEAAQVKPRFAGAWYNLGNTYLLVAQFELAIRSYEQALEIDPTFALAHWNCAFVRLLCGDFEKGWPEYESRWQLEGVVRRDFQQPLWDGSDLHGQTILLHAEQGLGDTIHFVRYAALAKQRGGDVIVQCQPELLPLLAGVPGIDRLIDRDAPLPDFDVRAELLSLPGILHTELATIPAEIPYLQAEQRLVEKWRDLLAPLRTKARLLVGIAWQGRPTHSRDRQRSIPLATFGRLADVRGVQLVSLQHGSGSEQLRELGGRFSVHVPSIGQDDPAAAFLDSAAIIQNMDVIVSVDTVFVHLAGALARPIWVPLSLIPDWRWLLGRDDSPWYPTMRLFRQTQRGKWDDVFIRIAEQLAKKINMGESAQPM
jgi:tetratricopeptide (TPR) repeat protein